MTRAVFLTAAVLLVSLPAWAQAPPTASTPAKALKGRLLLVPVEADLMEDADKQAFESAARKALDPYKTLVLLPPMVEDPLEVMMDLECMEMDATCVAGFAKIYKAEFVVRVVVDEEGQARALLHGGGDGALLKETLLSSAPGAPIASEARPVVLALLGPPPKPKPEDGLLIVTSTVKGVTVFVNGTPYGPAPTEKRFPPGTYTVTGRKLGHDEQIREVIIKAGMKTSVPLALKATPAPPIVPVVAAAQKDKAAAGAAVPVYKTWWFWTAVGVGTAAILAPSIYFLTRSEDGPSGSMDLVIHPVTFQDDVLLRTVKP